VIENVDAKQPPDGERRPRPADDRATIPRGLLESHSRLVSSCEEGDVALTNLDVAFGSEAVVTVHAVLSCWGNFRGIKIRRVNELLQSVAIER